MRLHLISGKLKSPVIHITAFLYLASIPYVGKIWRGKILANLANAVQFAKIFFANTYKYSEITEDLPADSPKFSPSKFFPHTVILCFCYELACRDLNFA